MSKLKNDEKLQQLQDAVAAARQKINSPMQLKFAEHYFKTGQGAESVKVGGYKIASNNVAAVQANRLLKYPHIAEFLDAMNALAAYESADELIDEKTKIRDMLMKAAELCAAPVEKVDVQNTVDEHGNTKEVITIRTTIFNPKGMVSSLSEINRMYGYHAAQKYETTQMTLEEALALADKRAKEQDQ